MVNILFVLYHDFSSNSATHVHNFANSLARLGASCVVAVPNNKESVSVIGQPLYQPMTFGELKSIENRFKDSRGPDIIHAWTPREIVRTFCEKVKNIYSDCKLVIHLEDNEEFLLEKFTQRSIPQLKQLICDKAYSIPSHLSDPFKYRHFLEHSDGETVIIEQLNEFVPNGKRTLTLWPGVDTTVFYPRERSHETLLKLGVPLNGTVLCYTGNVHLANASEVRSLYLAVAMLNREGYPVTLIRAGQDFCQFLGEHEIWGRKYSVELGYKPHKEVPEILALADVLVQPGKRDDFNDYRLPSKLPEFLAMGKPVILPDTNIGRFMESMHNAIVLPKVDAVGIVEAIKALKDDRALCERLGKGAWNFAKENLDWAHNGQKLLDFYQSILDSDSRLMTD